MQISTSLFIRKHSFFLLAFVFSLNHPKNFKPSTIQTYPLSECACVGEKQDFLTTSPLHTLPATAERAGKSFPLKSGSCCRVASNSDPGVSPVIQQEGLPSSWCGPDGAAGRTTLLLRWVVAQGDSTCSGMTEIKNVQYFSSLRTSWFF